MGLRHDPLLLIPILTVLVASGCDGGAATSPLDPLDLSRWGRGGEDLEEQPVDGSRLPEDVAADAEPRVPGPCDAPAADPLRVYFSRNVLGYEGGLPLCGGQNLGIRVAQLIDAATESVDLAGMQVQDFHVLDALAAAADRGAQVRVYLDDGYHAPEENGGLEELVAAGVSLSHDGAGTDLMHNKFLVVDGRWTWTGSANFSSYDAISNANASLLFDSPPLAGIYGERFDRLWGEHGAPGSGDGHSRQEGGPATAMVGGLPVEVWFTPSWDVVDRLVTIIEGAESSIHFEIFAFTLDELRAALDDRCGEVELIGIYDGDQDGDPASIASLPWCADAVVVPAKLPGSYGYRKLHHKLLVVDGRVVATGSMNWSLAGALENDENLVILEDEPTAALFEAELMTRLEEAL